MNTTTLNQLVAGNINDGVATYRDYSQLSQQDFENLVRSNKIYDQRPAAFFSSAVASSPAWDSSPANTSPHPQSSQTDHSFPAKLHYVLSEMEKDGLDHIVSWQPHGRCFLVHHQKELVTKVLSLWFRQTKFASFQRQLSLYGFRRVNSGPDKGAYYHQCFLRSRRFLTGLIHRVKVNGKGVRTKTSETPELKFYDMPYLPPENDITSGSISGSCSTDSSTGTILSACNGVGEARDCDRMVDDIEVRAAVCPVGSTSTVGAPCTSALGTQQMHSPEILQMVHHGLGLGFTSHNDQRLLSGVPDQQQNPALGSLMMVMLREQQIRDQAFRQLLLRRNATELEARE